ncbi:MAG: trypsin-like peptidase domain-containing protein [Stenomitos rutilans HA7619-LM2]|jgi:serine protease Do|nr:trypsin-like peptidase domain-containing protein [Stenomitos rutilans HA7619-LM2]
MQENQFVQPGIVQPDLAGAIAAIAKHLRQSTVQVRTQRQGAGSGVIWSADGVIMTNAHVVTGNSATVELADGQVLEAVVTARNRQRDLVALKVEATGLTAGAIADSTRLRVGEVVVAMGNPWGVVGALTTGIIHSFKPHYGNQHWIQADIQLAPGNSGGPLANAQGQIIGINTMIVHGRGFAVPSHVVQQFLSQGSDEPFLGITAQPVGVRLARQLAIGLLLTAIEPQSPAEIAGLQAGDVLLGVRGNLFQSPNELFHLLENSNVGDGLPLEVLRQNRRFTVDVVLCSKTFQPQAA